MWFLLKMSTHLSTLIPHVNYIELLVTIYQMREHNICKRRQCSEMIIVVWHDSIPVIRCHKPWIQRVYPIVLYANYKVLTQHTSWPFRVDLTIQNTPKIFTQRTARVQHISTPSIATTVKAYRFLTIYLVGTVKWTHLTWTMNISNKTQQQKTYICAEFLSIGTW